MPYGPAPRERRTPRWGRRYRWELTIVGLGLFARFRGRLLDRGLLGLLHHLLGLRLADRLAGLDADVLRHARTGQRIEGGRLNGEGGEIRHRVEFESVRDEHAFWGDVR